MSFFISIIEFLINTVWHIKSKRNYKNHNFILQMNPFPDEYLHFQLQCNELQSTINGS